MTANDRQVGGEHYRRDGKRETQHWDLMAALDAGYFPAVITKYVERHQDKAGRQDLEKALHYAEKYNEVETNRKDLGHRRVIRTDGGAQEEMIAEYVEEAGLSGSQALIFHTALLRHDDTAYLVTLCQKYLASQYPPETVKRIEEKIEQSAQELMKKDLLKGPGSPEDGGHHAPRVASPRKVPRIDSEVPSGL